MRLFHKRQSADEQTTTAFALTQDESMDWSGEHDRFLCARLNAGTPDEQSRAFGALYDRYELMIRNYVMKQLNYSEDDSIEVIGDTWLIFWRERMNFQWRDDAQTEQPLQSWLYGIARNRVKSKVRQNLKEKENIATVPLEQIHTFIESRLEDGVNRVESTSRQCGVIEDVPLDDLAIPSLANSHFNCIMKQLNPTEQQIVTLRYYRGLTYAEISQQLEKTSSAVRTAHTRLIQKLRQTLEAGQLDIRSMEQ